MDNPVGVQVLDTLHDLLEVLFGLLLIDFSPAGKKVVKVSIFAQLRYDVHVVHGLVDVVETDNVWMRDLLHDFYFGLDIFDIVAVGE
jgi:hypothetical protein